MSKPSRYSDHLDTLIALVTHLAMSEWSMRTPAHLAVALSIDEREIEVVLDGYKGLFRKSRTTAPGSGQHFYALQLRYARQWLEDGDTAEDGEGPRREPLETQYLTALLDFVARRAAAEGHRDTGLLTAAIAAGGSILVAVLTIVYVGGG